MHTHRFYLTTEKPTTDTGSLLDHIWVRNIDMSNAKSTILDAYWIDHNVVSLQFHLQPTCISRLHLTQKLIPFITLSSTFHLLPTYAYASNKTLIIEYRLSHSIGAHYNKLHAQHIDIFLHSSNKMTDVMQHSEASKK